MTPLRWILVLSFVPIVVAGQICTNSWPVSLMGVTASADGKIFAAVTHQTNMETEIWQWSDDLSSRKRLWQLPGYFLDVQTDRSGSILVCESSVEFAVYDVQRRAKLWHTPTSSTGTWGPINFKAHLVGDDRYLLIVEGTGYTPLSISLVDVRGGAVIERIDGVISNRPRYRIHQVYFDKDRVTFEYADQTKVAFAWTESGLSQVAVAQDAVLGTEGKLLKHQITRRTRRSVSRGSSSEDSISENLVVRVTPRDQRSASRIQIEDRLNSTVVHRDQLGMATPARENLAWIVALIAVGWVMLLIVDGTRSIHPQRGVIDIAITCTFLTLLTTSGVSDLVPKGLVIYQLARPLEIVCSVLTVWVFLCLSSLQRPLHFWAAIFVAACVPVLLPFVALALLMPRFRLRAAIWPVPAKVSDNGFARSKLRFGIGELLMITTVVGVLLSVGSSSMELVSLGFGYAALVAFTIVFSIMRPVAVTLIAFSVFGLVAHACSTPVRPTFFSLGGISFLTTVMTIAMLRVYGRIWFAPASVEVPGSVATV